MATHQHWLYRPEQPPWPAARPPRWLPMPMLLVTGLLVPLAAIAGLEQTPQVRPQQPPLQDPSQIRLPLIETLPQSIERRRAFPFQANCDGNTKEMLACLWQRRDQQDQRLASLLTNAEDLELWRGVRQRLCRRAAARGAGGSIAPLLGLECELELNATLLRQISGPLVP